MATTLPATTLPAATGFGLIRKHGASNQGRQNNCHAHNSISNHHGDSSVGLRNGEPYEQRIRGPLAVTAPLSGTNNPDDIRIARQVDPIEGVLTMSEAGGRHFLCQELRIAHGSPARAKRHNLPERVWSSGNQSDRSSTTTPSSGRATRLRAGGRTAGRRPAECHAVG